jgi:hypothetical protein
MVLTGCTCSVHPILNESDLTKDVDLTGTWELEAKNPRGKRTFSAEALSDKSEYDITFDGKKFVARIGKIGEHRYVQLKKQELESQGTPLLTGIGVYGFARFEVSGDKLRIYAFDDRRAADNLKKHKVPFVVHQPSGGIEFHVLTADTAAVQKLISQAGDEIFTSKPMVYKRTN